MKTEHEIKYRLADLLSDDRVFNNDGSLAKCATTNENIPLALIQVEVEAKVETLKWILSNSS